jgi:hypothetical protein
MNSESVDILVVEVDVNEEEGQLLRHRSTLILSVGHGVGITGSLGGL